MFDSDRVNCRRGRVLLGILLVDLLSEGVEDHRWRPQPVLVKQARSSLLIATTIGRAFSRGARPTPTDHLPMLAPGTRTPKPLILGQLFRLVADRCHYLELSRFCALDVCGRFARSDVIK